MSVAYNRESKIGILCINKIKVHKQMIVHTEKRFVNQLFYGLEVWSKDPRRLIHGVHSAIK